MIEIPKRMNRIKSGVSSRIRCSWLQALRTAQSYRYTHDPPPPRRTSRSHAYPHAPPFVFTPLTEPGDCAGCRAAVCLHEGDDAPARAFGKDSGGQRRRDGPAHGAHEAVGARLGPQAQRRALWRQDVFYWTGCNVSPWKLVSACAHMCSIDARTRGVGRCDVSQ